MAIRMKAMLKRTERNTKGEACSRAFFTTTKVTPQISEQNVSDRSAFRRRRMGGRLRQVHVSVFAKRIGVHGARVQHRGRSGKVTLSVNNAGMKFQYSTLNKLYVVSTAKEIPGRRRLAQTGRPVLLPNKGQALRRGASILLINGAAADNRLEHVCRQKLLWRRFCEIARKDHEVSELSDF